MRNDNIKLQNQIDKINNWSEYSQLNPLEKKILFFCPVVVKFVSYEI